jgi:hypothetical protein
LAQLRAFLSSPWVASLLGAGIGFALVAAIVGSRNVFASSERDGVTNMMLAMMGSMIVATVVLLVYALAAQGGFLWFGLSLVGGFAVGLAVFGLRLARR